LLLYITLYLLCLDGWKKDILEKMDESELPVYWGGTKTGHNGDPKCLDVVCIGGQVHHSYYVDPEDFFKSKNVVSDVVRKGTMLEVERKITESGSLIRWKFATEKHDIAFAVYRKEGKSMEEVIPKERVCCSLVPESGSLVCAKPGLYVFLFDNTYSYFHSKKLHYTIDILKP